MKRTTYLLLLFAYALMLGLMGTAMTSCGNSANGQTANAEDENGNTLLNERYVHVPFTLKLPTGWKPTDINTLNASFEEIITENSTIAPSSFHIEIKNVVYEEPTSLLVNLGLGELKETFPGYHFLGKSETEVSGCKGTLAEFEVDLEGYELLGREYVVKKPDSTICIIHSFIQKDRQKSQTELIDAIVHSVRIF